MDTTLRGNGLFRVLTLIADWSAVTERRMQPLACALAGMRQAVSAQQRAVASAMPLKTKQHRKIQRLRRLLDNAKLTAAAVYHPIGRRRLELPASLPIY